MKLPSLGQGFYRTLLFQLRAPWDESRDAEKKKIIEKASEDCLLVCKAIAPESGDKLLKSLEFSKEETIDRPARDDLVILMTAYKNATSKNLKKQILSLYAFRYSVKTIQAIHSPYGKRSSWQISRPAHTQRSMALAQFQCQRKNTVYALIWKRWTISWNLRIVPVFIKMSHMAIKFSNLIVARRFKCLMSCEP